MDTLRDALRVHACAQILWAVRAMPVHCTGLTIRCKIRENLFALLVIYRVNNQVFEEFFCYFVKQSG